MLEPLSVENLYVLVETQVGERKMEIINMKLTSPSFAGFKDGGRRTQAKKFR